MLEAGCTDVNQEIATQVSKALVMSELQNRYIATASIKDVAIIIDNISLLIELMSESHKVDEKAIKVIKDNLRNLRALYVSPEED